MLKKKADVNYKKIYFTYFHKEMLIKIQKNHNKFYTLSELLLKTINLKPSTVQQSISKCLNDNRMLASISLWYFAKLTYCFLQGVITSNVRE